MKGTYDPDVVLMGFGSEQGYNNFFEWGKNNGLIIRELRFFSIQLPMRDKKIFNEKLNALKQFVHKPRFTLDDYKIMGFNVSKLILNKLREQTRIIQFENIQDWKQAVTHPCSNACLHFVGFQDYEDKYNTDDEKENYKNLKSLKTTGYKRKGEELICKDKMPKHLEKELKKRGEWE